MILRLGDRAVDITHRALVMGILNRTPDSFYDQGEFWNFDSFLRLAEQHVNNGADLLDVGGVKAGPGPEVTEAEEHERVLPAIEALVTRFDTPISVDTWRASVARAAYKLGAVVGNDISGFGDADYLPAAAAAGATVIATHIRLKPRVADPEPVYDDVVREVNEFLAARAEWALEAGVARDRIVLDAGLDLGKTWQQSLTLLRNSDSLVALGFPVLLSSSNKTFLGKLLDLELGDRRDASHAASALGVIGGCRIVRVHDVAGSRSVCDFLAALMQEAA
ncbi:MAG: dihydropteroate synthase [Actinobacteria bacterium]|nr:dihydropteroate synthase [Actinomycetota bacterium]